MMKDRPAGGLRLSSGTKREQDADGLSTTLHICSLGGFAIESCGQTVSLDSCDQSNAGNRVVISLLAYLAANVGEAVGRKTLMDEFWPDSEGDRAANSLSRTLSGLRRFLRTSLDHRAVLVRTRNGDSYKLWAPSRPWVDEEEFTVRMTAGSLLKKSGDLEGALEEFEAAEYLYKGDYMKDLPHGSWCLPKRAQLRQLHQTALFEISDIAESLGRGADAASYLFKLLDHDPTHESAYQKLIELYWRNGNRSEALKVFDVYREAVHTRLKLEPHSTILSLRQRILAGEEAPARDLT